MDEVRGRLEEGLKQKASGVTSIHLASQPHSPDIVALPVAMPLLLPAAYPLWLCRMPQNLLISFIQASASLHPVVLMSQEQDAAIVCNVRQHSPGPGRVHRDPHPPSGMTHSPHRLRHLGSLSTVT